MLIYGNFLGEVYMSCLYVLTFEVTGLFNHVFLKNTKNHTVLFHAI